MLKGIIQKTSKTAAAYLVTGIALIQLAPVFFNTFPDVLAPQGTITIDSTQMNSSLDDEIAVNTSGLKAYKPRVICAGDMELPEGVHCVDPTQPIATLVNGETPFHLTFILEQATGYRVWKKPTQPYGTGFHPPRQVDTPQIEEVTRAFQYLPLKVKSSPYY